MSVCSEGQHGIGESGWVGIMCYTVSGLGIVQRLDGYSDAITYSQPKHLGKMKIAAFAFDFHHLSQHI